ncbi:hypothetical protein BDZ97DRAFT_1758638 [Flammula alnicola]|nr:hypothetical protein BDZ97DRAFT_1758638 [Flammula alnicola]
MFGGFFSRNGAEADEEMALTAIHGSGEHTDTSSGEHAATPMEDHPSNTAMLGAISQVFSPVLSLPLYNRPTRSILPPARRARPEPSDLPSGSNQGRKRERDDDQKGDDNDISEYEESKTPTYHTKTKVRILEPANAKQQQEELDQKTAELRRAIEEKRSLEQQLADMSVNLKTSALSHGIAKKELQETRQKIHDISSQLDAVTQSEEARNSELSQERLLNEDLRNQLRVEQDGREKATVLVEDTRRKAEAAIVREREEERAKADQEANETYLKALQQAMKEEREKCERQAKSHLDKTTKDLKEMYENIIQGISCQLDTMTQSEEARNSELSQERLLNEDLRNQLRVEQDGREGASVLVEDIRREAEAATIRAREEERAKADQEANEKYLNALLQANEEREKCERQAKSEHDKAIQDLKKETADILAKLRETERLAKEREEVLEGQQGQINAKDASHRKEISDLKEEHQRLMDIRSQYSEQTAQAERALAENKKRLEEEVQKVTALEAQLKSMQQQRPTGEMAMEVDGAMTSQGLGNQIDSDQLRKQQEEMQRQFKRRNERHRITKNTKGKAPISGRIIPRGSTPGPSQIRASPYPQHSSTPAPTHGAFPYQLNPHNRDESPPIIPPGDHNWGATPGPSQVTASPYPQHSSTPVHHGAAPYRPDPRNRDESPPIIPPGDHNWGVTPGPSHVRTSSNLTRSLTSAPTYTPDSFNRGQSPPIGAPGAYSRGLTPGLPPGSGFEPAYNSHAACPPLNPSDVPQQSLSNSDPAALVASIRDLTEVVGNMRREFITQMQTPPVTPFKSRQAKAHPFKPPSAPRPRTEDHNELMKDVRREMNIRLGIDNDKNIDAAIANGHIALPKEAADLDEGKAAPPPLDPLRPYWDIPNSFWNFHLATLFAHELVNDIPELEEHRNDIIDHFLQRIATLAGIARKNLPRDGETEEEGKKRRKQAEKVELHVKRIKTRRTNVSNSNKV